MSSPTYRNTEPGVVGKVLGPSAGQTPADDSDLRSNGDNPYAAQGTPPIAVSGPSGFPLGSPPGYFVNPPASGGNPYSQSAPTKGQVGDDQASQYAADQLAAQYANIIGNQQPAYDSQPTSSEVYQDQGYGADGQSRS
jgi:hypothetical protein